jgi:hypothetical protein
MGTFTASLRSVGDVNALAATVALEDGRLSIAAGSTEIGSWPLADIHLEPIPTGYRMAAEGDQILIELKDVDSFAAELNPPKKRRLKIPGLGKTSTTTATAPQNGSQPDTTPSQPTRPAPTVIEDRPARVVAMPPPVDSPQAPRKSEPMSKEPSGTSVTARGLALVDGTMEKASRRLGPYLPEWMFTRFMFGVAFTALILMIVLPGLVSTFLLIAGALLVVFGAVVYSDPMLASRWLPGRTTPPHVLLFGVAVLMLGVLLGVIAR